MSDIGKTALKNKIDAKIYDNESQLITGAILNEVLQDAVDTLADGGNLDAGSVDTANLNDEAVTKGKLEQNVSADLDWAVASNSYYRNSQAGDVAAKVITTYKNMNLIGGGSLKVTFEQANTADDATLNIDGKGAKPLYYNGARVSSTNSWEAGETVEIYYNNYTTGIYYAKRWMVEPVSVSQNTLSIGSEEVGELAGQLEENPEWVKVVTDSEDKILYGIRADSKFYFGDGCPPQVQEYIQDKINELSLDEYEDIVAFLSDYLGSDTTLKVMIDGINAQIANKLDAEGLDPDALETVQVVENPEWISVTTDSEEKVLGGRKTDGAVVENVGIETNKFKTKRCEVSEELILSQSVKKALEENIVNGGEIILSSLLPESVSTGTTYVYEVKLAKGQSFYYCGLGDAVCAISLVYEDDTREAVNDGSGIYPNSDYYITVRKDTKSLRVYVATGTSYGYKLFQTYYNIINDNKEREIWLNASKMSDTNKSLLWSMLADVHADFDAMNNMVTAVNETSAIDNLLIAGDTTRVTFDEFEATLAFSIFNKLNKPYYVVLGNHDVGNTRSVELAASFSDMYNVFIKPMVNKGYLVTGEYSVGKSYYYHDFLNYNKKIRLIVLNEFDAPYVLDENDYWTPITYDSNAPQIKHGYHYVYDANNPTVVNCGKYTGHSFQLTADVTTNSSTQYDQSGTCPLWKYTRGERIIMKEQMDWFIEVLNNTPANYGIVVATHMPFSGSAVLENDDDFCVDYKYAHGDYESLFPGGEHLISMETDILADIVNAYINKETLSEKVIMKQTGFIGSVPATLNTQNDGDDVYYAYKVEADFTSRPNSSFVCFVGGHCHRDYIFRHPVYTEEIGIHPLSSRADYSTSDMARGITQGIARDAFTCIALRPDYSVVLSRIGNNVTYDGKLRNFEILNNN